MSLTVNSPEAFAKHIEEQVTKKRMTYMDAILTFCADRELEPEAIVPFISAKMKGALEHEGIALHFLKKRNELPLG